MGSKTTHPYHIIEPSPRPLQATIGVGLLATGGLMLMHNKPYALFVLLGGLAFISFVLFLWWRDVVREAVHDKAHNPIVQAGLRLGMALFILSEIMFFFGFFFSFFKAVLLPVGVLSDGQFFPGEAMAWPPEHIVTFDPFDLPFMNTLILLLSGTTVTWAHHALTHGTRKEFRQAILYTVILGFLFSCLQAYEYSHAGFGMTDGIYASNFYLATGFHGLHVIIGTIFLLVCYFRAFDDRQLTKKDHLGFEFAAWYWHFVDVVWLFLFVVVYVWGS